MSIQICSNLGAFLIFVFGICLPSKSKSLCIRQHGHIEKQILEVEVITEQRVFELSEKTAKVCPPYPSCNVGLVAIIHQLADTPDTPSLLLKYVIRKNDVTFLTKGYSKCMENTTATNTAVNTEASTEANTATNTSTVTKEVKRASRPKAIIRRNTDDKIIAGVCSGIADYYDIDPVIVRLIAGMTFLTLGVGPLVYILLWIVLPSKQMVAQRATQTTNNDGMQGALSS